LRSENFISLLLHKMTEERDPIEFEDLSFAGGAGAAFEDLLFDDVAASPFAGAGPAFEDLLFDDVAASPFAGAGPAVEDLLFDDVAASSSAGAGAGAAGGGLPAQFVLPPFLLELPRPPPLAPAAAAAAAPPPVEKRLLPKKRGGTPLRQHFGPLQQEYEAELKAGLQSNQEIQKIYRQRINTLVHREQGTPFGALLKLYSDATSTQGGTRLDAFGNDMKRTTSPNEVFETGNLQQEYYEGKLANLKLFASDTTSTAYYNAQKALRDSFEAKNKAAGGKGGGPANLAFFDYAFAETPRPPPSGRGGSKGPRGPYKKKQEYKTSAEMRARTKEWQEAKARAPPTTPTPPSRQSTRQIKRKAQEAPEGAAERPAKRSRTEEAAEESESSEDENSDEEFEQFPIADDDNAWEYDTRPFGQNWDFQPDEYLLDEQDRKLQDIMYAARIQQQQGAGSSSAAVVNQEPPNDDERDAIMSFLYPPQQAEQPDLPFLQQQQSSFRDLGAERKALFSLLDESEGAAGAAAAAAESSEGRQRRLQQAVDLAFAAPAAQSEAAAPALPLPPFEYGPLFPALPPAGGFVDEEDDEDDNDNDDDVSQDAMLLFELQQYAREEGKSESDLQQQLLEAVLSPLEAAYQKSTDTPAPDSAEMKKLMAETNKTKQSIQAWFSKRRGNQGARVPVKSENRGKWRTGLVSHIAPLEAAYQKSTDTPAPDSAEMIKLMAETNKTQQFIQNWFGVRRFKAGVKMGRVPRIGGRVRRIGGRTAGFDTSPLEAAYQKSTKTPAADSAEMIKLMAETNKTKVFIQQWFAKRRFKEGTSGKPETEPGAGSGSGSGAGSGSAS
jgi:hypothetical protein